MNNDFVIECKFPCSERKGRERILPMCIKEIPESFDH